MRVVFSTVVGLLVISAAPAYAQRDLEVPIQFDFINPGARSLSLAGAFIGLADDATAATTNPAGLQRLARPEVSIEVRGWRFVTEFVGGGRLSGRTTGIGVDVTEGPLFAETETSTQGVSFLSVVYPRGRWSFAGYRQEASRLRAGARTEGVFTTRQEGSVLRDFREYPSIVERSIDVINYGGSAAIRQGIVSLGAGVTLSQFSYDSSLTGYELPPLAQFYSASAYSQVRFANVQTGDDWGLGFSAGALIVPNERVQIGATYRRGAAFEFEGAFNYPAFPSLSGPYTGEFKVPDNMGVGFAVRPLDGLTVALDLNRVTYSDLQDFIQAQVRFEPQDRALYSIDDATEIHLGAEYVLTRFSVLPAIRAGFWRETEHSVTYSGSNPVFLATASLAKSINHVAFGGGIAPSQRLEINAGFDLSARANTISFSAIVRF